MKNICRFLCRLSSLSRVVTVFAPFLALSFALSFTMLSLAWTPMAVAGSPFYLTVERGYSTTEVPVVRLDYTNPTEVYVLRVLKAENLSEFLAGQLQISRSYEEPVTKINPGHYLARGINQVQSPLADFRSLLSPDFRKELRGESPATPLFRVFGNAPLVNEPRERVHSAPKGFQVVREIYLDLQQGGKAVNDLYWWFYDENWSEYRYKTRQIELDPLNDGVYLLQVLQGDNEAQSLLQVSSLAVQVKQSSSQLLIRAADRQGRPVANAVAEYRDGRGQWQKIPEETDRDGQLLYNNPQGVIDGRLIVKVSTADGRVALTDTDFLPIRRSSPDVFVMTDRPIFRPGDEFFYKGTVRKIEGGGLALPEVAKATSVANVDFANTAKGAISSANMASANTAKVNLARVGGGDTVGVGQRLEQNVALSPYGSFSGRFELSEEDTPGLYQLVAQIKDVPYAGELRVRDYVKPKFYLDVVERDPIVVPGKQFTLKFRAKRYSGGVASGVRFESYIYRKKFDVPQFVSESAGLSAGSDYSGEVKTEQSLAQPQRIYSSVEERVRNRSELSGVSPANFWDTAQEVDADGSGLVVISVPPEPQAQREEWIYSVVVRAKDQGGSTAVLSESIFMTLSEVVGSIVLDRRVVAVGGEQASIRVYSTYPDGSFAPRVGGVVTGAFEGDGGRVFEASFTTDERGVARLVLPGYQRSGKLQLRGQLNSLEGKALKVPPALETKDLIIAAADGGEVVKTKSLELYPLKDVLSRGERTRVLVVLPEQGQANKMSGELSGEKGKKIGGRVLSSSIVADRIYSSGAQVVAGQSVWLDVEAKEEYGTGFFLTVSTSAHGGKFLEQTIGFRIIPSEKILSIKVLPEKVETEPGKPFTVRLLVADSNGKPAPRTELAVSIVDRAVYDVQPEFRPNVLDFFYPMARLNLATFYSDELQGYGYADMLRRPNFSLSALKSQSKPVKRTERDTAGWFPHVLTNERGEAEVRAEMPSNLTEWLVTAVGVDDVGRVGEGKGVFKTTTDVAVEAILPQFLRQGDRVEGALLLSNKLERSVELGARVVAADGVSVAPGVDTGKGGEQSREVTVQESGGQARHVLPAKGEYVVRIPLLAAVTEGGATIQSKAALSVAISAVDTVRVGGGDVFDLPLREARTSIVVPGERVGDIVTFPVGDQAKVTELSLQVYTGGLVGAALNLAPQLLSYPYGCTEQLVSKLVPNLVLLDLAEKAGVTDKDLPGLSQLVAKAKSNAAAGLGSIKARQLANGGVELWPGSKTPDCEATLLVAAGLRYAATVGFQQQYDDMMWSMGKWLGESPDCLPRRGGWGFAKFSEAQIYRNGDVSQRIASFVKGVKDNPSASLEELINALTVVQASSGKQVRQTAESAVLQGSEIRKVLADRILRQLDGFDARKYYNAQFQYGAQDIPHGYAALVASAMGVLQNEQALTPELKSRLKRVILEHLRGGAFMSTYDTSQVIFAALPVMKEELAELRSSRPREAIRVEMLPQRGVSGERGVTGVVVGEAGEPELLGELRPVPYGQSGVFADLNGRLFDRVALRGLLTDDVVKAQASIESPSDAVVAVANGISVVRRMRVMRGGNSGGDGRGNSGGNSIDVTGNTILAEGDTVISELIVARSGKTPWDYAPGRTIVVEDNIPSFAEGVEDEGRAFADAGIGELVKEAAKNVEVRDVMRYPERIKKVILLSWRGEAHLFQVWRVRFRGESVLPPAQAFEMYDPRITGNSEGIRLMVK